MTVMTSSAPAETRGQIRLVEPLPGFARHTEWTLTPIDAGGVLHSLRSVDDPGLRFVLTPAAVYFPDYDCSFATVVAPSLGGDDLDVMLMLTVGSSLQTATANLRAPIVICRSTGRAVQVVLDEPALSMRCPLVAEAV